MADNDTRTIYKLLKEKGWTMTLRRKTQGTYNPSSGVTGQSTTNHSFTGVMLSVKSEQIDGTTVLQSDRQCIMSSIGLTVTPTLNDSIVDDDGTLYKIFRVQKIRQKDSVIAFICLVRT